MQTLKEVETKKHFETHVLRESKQEPIAIYNQGGVEFISKPDPVSDH